MNNTLENTQIYKVLREILLTSLIVFPHISKGFKYNLGTMYLQSVIQLNQLIMYAYIIVNPITKEQHLVSAFYKYIDAICYLRLLQDTNNISKDNFIKILTNLESIKIQIINWIRSINPLSPIISKDLQ